MPAQVPSHCAGAAGNWNSESVCSAARPPSVSTAISSSVAARTVMRWAVRHRWDGGENSIAASLQLC
jgi:hypothetical protein